MLAAMLGGFLGTIVGFALIAMGLFYNQVRMERRRSAETAATLAELHKELTGAIEAAIAEENLRSLTTVPQPSAEA